jgi:hypothetical protein
MLVNKALGGGCHADVYQHLSQKNGVIAKDAETSSA